MEASDPLAHPPDTFLARPRYIQFKRNEVTVAPPSPRHKGDAVGTARRLFRGRDRAQRNTLALRDVDYAVEAEIRFTERRGPDDNANKFDEMFRRRLEKGQFHMQPYLGCREFPACVEIYDGSPLPLHDETRGLGMMLHDLRYGPAGNKPVFFDARLDQGILQVPEWEDRP